MAKKVILKKSTPSKNASATVKNPSTPSPDEEQAAKVQTFDQAVRQAAAAEGKPVPKKRGRPSNAELAARSAATLAPGASTTAPGTQPSLSGHSVAPTAATPQAAPFADIPKELLVPAIKAPFEIKALNTGFKGWELSDPEADVLAVQVDACIRRYLPMAELGPHAPLWALLITAGVIGGTRVISYASWKKETTKRRPVTVQEPAPQAAEDARPPARSELAPIKTHVGPGALTAAGLGVQS